MLCYVIVQNLCSCQATSRSYLSLLDALFYFPLHHLLGIVLLTRVLKDVSGLIEPRHENEKVYCSYGCRVAIRNFYRFKMAWLLTNKHLQNYELAPPKIVIRAGRNRVWKQFQPKCRKCFVIRLQRNVMTDPIQAQNLNFILVLNKQLIIILTF